MKLTPELERIARAKFGRLHRIHRKPGSDEDFDVALYPSPTTDHVRVQCECGYGWRYPERELYAEEKTPTKEIA